MYNQQTRVQRGVDMDDKKIIPAASDIEKANDVGQSYTMEQGGNGLYVYITLCFIWAVMIVGAGILIFSDAGPMSNETESSKSDYNPWH